MTPLPVPPHFDPDSVGDVWRVPYDQRAREARAWAAEHGLQAATEDDFRLCVLAVDVQNTFCIPDFELFVAGRSGTGAVDDNRRLCEFIYRNLGTITRIFPSLDTHEAMQIFHPLWLIDEDGNHPEPYTLVSAEDVAKVSDPVQFTRESLGATYGVLLLQVRNVSGNPIGVLGHIVHETAVNLDLLERKAA